MIQTEDDGLNSGVGSGDMNRLGMYVMKHSWCRQIKYGETGKGNVKNYSQIPNISAS